MHRAAQVFGVFLAIAGALYSVVAINALVHVQDIATTLEFAKAPEHPQFGFTSIEAWSSGVRLNSWLFLGVGVPALLCGIGLVALREWARLFWLGASIVIILVVLILVYWDAEAWKRYIELLALAVPSFIVLRARLQRQGHAI